MKLYELFISEKISLVVHKDLIESLIIDGIEEGVQQVYYKFKRYPDERIESVNDGYLDNVAMYAARELMTQLRVMIPVSVSHGLTNSLGIPVLSTARSIGNSEAMAEENKIVYNLSLIAKLVNPIIDSVINHAMANYSKENPLFNAFRDSFLSMPVHSIVSSSPVKSVIDYIVSVTIHELAHVIQFINQVSAGRSSIEYRSYLSPSKKSFHNLVRSFADTPATADSYKIYQASPQEIAAFAQQEALDIIRRNGIRTRKDLGNNTDKVITTHMYDTFKTPANPAEYKVFKRFAKLVYQAVIDYVDGK